MHVRRAWHEDEFEISHVMRSARSGSNSGSRHVVGLQATQADRQCRRTSAHVGKMRVRNGGPGCVAISIPLEWTAGTPVGNGVGLWVKAAGAQCVTMLGIKAPVQPRHTVAYLCMIRYTVGHRYTHLGAPTARVRFPAQQTRHFGSGLWRPEVATREGGRPSST